MSTHILMVHCRDERGLIYKITSVINKFNLNIVSNDEFVERNLNQFFMRTEFSGEFDKESFLNELNGLLPEDVEIKLVENRKKDIVILATKEYHCLGHLLIRHKFNDLNANILAVISNYSNLEELTQKFDVPFYCVEHADLSREDHEEKILEILANYNPELLVLAKYMRVLTPKLVTPYNNRIINIHHSFLPAFIGANPYLKAFERGVKIIGATAHFVNKELDEGPIISQNVIPVNHTYDAKEMARAGRDVERIVLADALKLVCEERVFVYQNRTIILN
jgi:formyltetrahydrofolate deformylase